MTHECVHTPRLSLLPLPMSNMKSGNHRSDVDTQFGYKLSSPLPLTSEATKCKSLQCEKSYLVLSNILAISLLKGQELHLLLAPDDGKEVLVVEYVPKLVP